MNQNVLANAEYKTQIATLAAADDLPDVFLLQGMNSIDWANQGLVYDLTSDIESSPYYDDYNQAYFAPFTVDGKIYGYPALTGVPVLLLFMIKLLWKEAVMMSSQAHGKKLRSSESSMSRYHNNSIW